jgi:signal transduction histidine kinase
MADLIFPLPEPLLTGLAPAAIRSYRALRYNGGGMGSSFAGFPPTERATLARMYAALQATFLALRDEATDEPGTLAKLRTLYGDTWASLIPAVRRLGEGIPAEQFTPQLRQTLHDIKGGAFQALAMHLQLIGMHADLPGQLHRMFFLARDHLKIMRNALPGIDPEGEARDEQQRLHAVELIVEKWQRADHRLADRAVTVDVQARYTGAIAERCLEFSALDRVIYNLVNNAAAHSADGRIGMAILPLPADGPHDIRLVVANAVTPEQRQAVQARFPTGPGALFEGGFTTGGSGLGMRICADFICNAYGVGSVEQGLAEGHFGASFLGDAFVAWVHWPIAAD